MFKKILVGTDLSKESYAALHAAISLAERCLATIECVMVAPFASEVYGIPNLLMPLTNIPTHLKDELEQFFPAKLYPNSKRQILVNFSIADAIQSHAKKENCDLIVVGTHGRGAVGRFLMGSVAQKLVRDSEIPVMVVRDSGELEQKYQGFTRVLAPTDFSETSTKAVKLAIQFANFLKADLHLVHVVDLPTVTDFTGLYPFLQIQMPDPSQLNVDNTLRALIKDEYLVGNAKVATLLGDPTREILQYMEENKINFVVLGTHGRRGIDRALLGSVTANMIAKSHVPVFTVSQARAVEPVEEKEKEKHADVVLL
jgi:nucleotide-binding universal stress UspA family protein